MGRARSDIDLLFFFSAGGLISVSYFGTICAVFRLGEVSEWSMVQPWKGCVGATPPGVRIPPSPPLNLSGNTPHIYITPSLHLRSFPFVICGHRLIIHPLSEECPPLNYRHYLHGNTTAKARSTLLVEQSRSSTIATRST